MFRFQLKYIWVALLILIVFSVNSDEIDEREYIGILENISQIYDGDTIRDARIKIVDVILDEEQLGEAWPGIVLRTDGVWVVTDIRIGGIDTPEMRVSKKKKDGTPRTNQSRENERKAAHASKAALKQLVTDAENIFTLRNPQIGKYAGRIVCDVYVDNVKVADYLIENGHAIEYDGGTKAELDWDNLPNGLMR